jgi:2'-5' RNA ligase
MRLFVAVNLPDLVRDNVWRIGSQIRDIRYPIRWVTVDAMHITIKFLGEVPADREDAITKSLEAAAAPVSPFDLRLDGFGAFPNSRRAKVIWVGCHASEQLKQLYTGVEGGLSELGFARENRTFHPHVTLGRVRRDSSPSKLTGLSNVLESLDADAEFRVRSIELMQSELSPAGAKYSVRASIGLSG